MVLKHWGITTAALAGAVWVTAASTPVEFGLFSPVQFPGSETTPVKGFRLNLGYTYNPVMYGLDLGMVNNAKKAAGFELGAFNVVHSMYGVQTSLYNRIGYTQDEEPVESAGLQLGWVNDVQTAFAGFQAGMANIGGTVSGIQLGFSNSVEKAAPGWTLQIGFLNFNDDGYWPIMPLVGWSSGTAPAAVEAEEAAQDAAAADSTITGENVQSDLTTEAPEPKAEAQAEEAKDTTVADPAGLTEDKAVIEDIVKDK